MKIETIYRVRVSNGASYSPSFPYEGSDKDIAVAIATAYIAQGKRVTVLEDEQALSEEEK